uniref:Uncharacterized protein n=1 Tax=Trypanosoma congolense (strain IL3000) TaxID=1068625 RepID=G0UQK9_TRYCI|nr:conserved hypothetical protein [Trypanosoma congolense IL3000]
MSDTSLREKKNSTMIDPKEIANKIREANRRRFEESSRMRQLKQEKREEMLERKAEEEASKPSGLLPYIIISLIFLSFPLSEPIVDWILVGAFVVLNGLWAIFYRSASYVNWLTLALCDFSLIRISHMLPEIPRLIMEAPPKIVATFIIANAIVLFTLYYAYVEKRAPWKRAPTFKKKKKKRVQSKKALRIDDNDDDDDDETLEEFEYRRDRMNRIDYMLSGVIVGNIAVMVLWGIVPARVILDTIRQAIAFFH